MDGWQTLKYDSTDKQWHGDGSAPSSAALSLSINTPGSKVSYVLFHPCFMFRAPHLWFASLERKTFGTDYHELRIEGIVCVKEIMSTRGQICVCVNTA